MCFILVEKNLKLSGNRIRIRLKSGMENISSDSHIEVHLGEKVEHCLLFLLECRSCRSFPLYNQIRRSVSSDLVRIAQLSKLGTCFLSHSVNTHPQAYDYNKCSISLFTPTFECYYLFFAMYASSNDSNRFCSLLLLYTLHLHLSMLAGLSSPCSVHHHLMGERS